MLCPKCSKQKKVSGLVIREFVNVVCAQFDFLKGSGLEGGWESHFAVKGLEQEEDVFFLSSYPGGGGGERWEAVVVVKAKAFIYWTTRGRVNNLRVGWHMQNKPCVICVCAADTPPSIII